MGYSNIERTYWTDQSLADDLNGDKIEVRHNSCGAFSIVWADAAATDAVVKAQESVDGTNWDDISGKSVTIGAATGFELIKFTAAELLCPWIRLVIVNNSESAATATVTYFFKGDR